MVLLKNDGTLPLHECEQDRRSRTVGDQTRYLLGNYTGTPIVIVSVLEGLKTKEFPDAQITFLPGTKLLRDEGDPAPGIALTNPQRQAGLAE